MERIGKAWLRRRIYQNKLNGRDSLIPREQLEKVKTKENTDDLFIYLITDPERVNKWNFGVFIVHMEGMREQLRGRDFKQHKEWVFNTHPDKVPSFKELMRAALIALVKCCTKILLWEERKKKSWEWTRGRKESWIKKKSWNGWYWRRIMTFRIQVVMVDCKGYKQPWVYPSKNSRVSCGRI